MVLYLDAQTDGRTLKDLQAEWLRHYPPDEFNRKIMAKPGDRDKAILKRLPKGPIRGVEVGVHEGWLSSQLLTARPALTLYMVDIWADPLAKASAIAATAFAGERAIPLHMTSSKAASLVGDDLDFVFIDADHEYESVKADILAWKPKTKLLCGHDYKQFFNCEADRRMFNGVVRAVDELLDNVEFDRDKTWFYGSKLPRHG